MTGWTGRALIFSGRRDPEWSVTPTQADALVARCRGLRLVGEDLPQGPPLGYRGVELVGPGDARVLAFSGFVQLTIAGETALRADPGGLLEKAILALAPAGAIPPSVLPH